MFESGTITNNGIVKNAGEIGGSGSVSGNAIVTLNGGTYSSPAIVAQSLDYNKSFENVFEFLEKMNATSYQDAQALENDIWPSGPDTINYVGLKGLDRSKYYYVVTTETGTNLTVLMGQQVAEKTATTDETRTYYLNGSDSVALWWWKINFGNEGTNVDNSKSSGSTVKIYVSDGNIDSELKSVLVEYSAKNYDTDEIDYSSLNLKQKNDTGSKTVVQALEGAGATLVTTIDATGVDAN